MAILKSTGFITYVNGTGSVIVLEATDGKTGFTVDGASSQQVIDDMSAGFGFGINQATQRWEAGGGNPKLRIVLCGHAGEHDALLHLGWTAHQWTARKGYAQTDEAKGNSKGETVWASRGCVARAKQGALEL
jgi:hypothetical protein